MTSSLAALVTRRWRPSPLDHDRTLRREVTNVVARASCLVGIEHLQRSVKPSPEGDDCVVLLVRLHEECAGHVDSVIRPPCGVLTDAASVLNGSRSVTDPPEPSRANNRDTVDGCTEAEVPGWLPVGRAAVAGSSEAARSIHLPLRDRPISLPRS